MTIKSGFPGTPVDRKGRFRNLDNPAMPRMTDVLKWVFSRNPQKKEKKLDPFRLTHRDDRQFLDNGNDCIIWLGHASFFIRLDGISLLIDPVFLHEIFLKRYADHAFGPDLFRSLDYLLLSHDHRDHCQEGSIRQVVRNNPGVTVLTGLGMEPLLRSWCGNRPIQCAGWYQQYKTTPPLEIFYVPTHHWCRRGLTDTNKRLWGGFVIRSAHKTVYFGGDTAAGGHFAEIRALFDPVDVAILGVGAYKPAWFMQQFHISPQAALQGFRETGARFFVPMHWGTFDLSDEPVGEPCRILLNEQAAGRVQDELKLLDLGENFYV